MEDSAHFADRSAVEDDYEVLFGPAERQGLTAVVEPTRTWRVYIAEDGYEGISSAMTLEGAREFAATLRDEGIAVLRIESAAGDTIQGSEMCGRVHGAPGRPILRLPAR